VRSPEKSAAELVVDRVRASIERGHLRSGDRLPAERELARELGLSRPSVDRARRAMNDHLERAQRTQTLEESANA
jgi:DNA-binding GntR family transcriptional regulator